MHASKCAALTPAACQMLPQVLLPLCTSAMQHTWASNVVGEAELESKQH